MSTEIAALEADIKEYKLQVRAEISTVVSSTMLMHGVLS